MHRLLTYLRMQSQRDPEVDFEQQWNALKPTANSRDAASNAAFPILDHFTRDRLGREMEEVLTVTETSQGLSFEYVWEAAKHDHFDERSRGPPDEALSYTSIFFPTEAFESSLSDPGPGKQDDNGQDVPLRAPGVVPVFDAHNLSVGSDYYIQLEEKSRSNLELDYPPALLTTEMDNPERLGDGASQCLTLRSLELEESSTEEDFFQNSADPKDASRPEEAHSTKGPESPFNSLFNDLDKSEALPSHQKIFDLMELNGVQADFKPPTLSSSLDDPKESVIARHLEREKPRKLFDCEPLYATDRLIHQDGFDQLDSEELSENFLFLQEKNLLKDSLSSKEHVNDLQTELRNAGFPEPMLETPSRKSVEAESKFAENKPYSSLQESISVHGKESGAAPKGGTGAAASPCSPQPQVPPTSLETQGPPHDVPPGAALKQGGARPTHPEGGVCEDSTCREANPDSTPAPPDTPAPTGNGSPALTQHGEGAVSLAQSDPSLVQDTAASKVSIGNGLPESRQNLENQLPLEDHGPRGPRERAREAAEVLGQLGRRDAAAEEGGLVSTLSSDSASQDSLLEDSLSAPGPASEPSVETPDSLDSMDVHEAFLGSLGPHAPQKLLTPDKPADSGYETENLESPEWTLHPAPEGAAAPDTASAGEDTPTGLPPKPVIVISDATDSHRGTEVTSQTAAPASQGSHRDSAYFSDNDSEPDRRSEGALGTSVSALGADQPLPEPGVPLQSPSPLDSCLDSSSSPPDPSCPPAPQKSRHLESREPAEPAPLDPPTHTLPPDDEAGSPSSLQNSELSSGDDLEAPEEPPCTLASTGTNTDELLALTHAPLRCGGPAAPTPEKALCGHSEGPKLKEPDVEGKYLGKLGVSGMLDLAEDGMDADEEDENSEDSDEDLRAFTLHSLSSESEDEAEHPVPVVLSREDGRHLRSLLKPVDPLPGCRRERKAVTFFDDVTVYLFDQVSVPCPLRVVMLEIPACVGATSVLGFSDCSSEDTDCDFSEKGVWGWLQHQFVRSAWGTPVT